MKKILILTAGFGEGHNTAANNIAKTLKKEKEYSPLILDLYAVTHPRFTHFLQKAYSFAINRLPFLWEWIFSFINNPGSIEKSLFLAKSLQQNLKTLLEREQPAAILSTYPFYGFLLRSLRAQNLTQAQVPFITIITDSTAINSSWYRAGGDFFVVPDKETASMLVHDGVDKERVAALGFPVDPIFSELRQTPLKSGPPWRLLYIPSSKKEHTLSLLAELRKLDFLEITVVTGKFTSLYKEILSSGWIDNKKISLLGWSEIMPELLCTHHLYLGKAGGAIVHEAIAASIPLLISHVVPGQEEGNIELIERLEIGRLGVHYAKNLAASVEEIFKEEGALWKHWKKNLEQISHPESTTDILELMKRLLA